jgi:sodium transport system ATP-binding protein
MVHDPRNVVLDEPTNGLDVMTTRAMRGFLRQLRAEGRCVLFSSHIMQEVAALCDRIVVIAKGRVVADGTADELRQRTGLPNLEDAFVKIIGSDEGLFA